MYKYMFKPLDARGTLFSDKLKQSLALASIDA